MVNPLQLHTEIQPTRHREVAQTVFSRFTGQNIVLLILTLIVATIAIAPLARLSVSALFDADGLAVERLSKLFARPQTATALINTLIIASLATLASLAIGIVFAVVMVFTDLKYKSALVFAFVLPLMIPPQVTAMAWIQAFSPSSPVLGMLGLAMEPGSRHPLYSMTGMVLLLGVYNAPLVYLSLQASLRRLPLNLAEAARAAGASPARTVFGVMLPLARGGILAAASLSFVSAIGNFGIQAMLGIPGRIPTLMTQIYQQVNNIGPSALPNMAMLSIVLVALTVSAVLMANWAASRTDTRIDLGAHRLTIPMGRYAWIIMAALWGYMIVSLLLPMSALLQTSLVPAFGLALSAETFTLKNYTAALFNQPILRDALKTSLWLTSVSVVVLTIIAVVLGYFLTWRRGPLVRVLQLCTDAAYALPGVSLGVALILMFLRPLPIIDVSLYGTPWIILIAYVAGFFALALRPVLSGYQQIDRNLEEAAQVAGASWGRRMKDIIFPLIAPAAMASAILVFMSAINEIQTSIMLISASARTLGPMIIFLEDGGSATLAAAVGCLMVFGILAVMLVTSMCSRYLPERVLPWQF